MPVRRRQTCLTAVSAHPGTEGTVNGALDELGSGNVISPPCHRIVALDARVLSSTCTAASVASPARFASLFKGEYPSRFTTSAGAGLNDQEVGQERAPDEESGFDREKILDAALKHVGVHGWSSAAIMAGLKDAGYSPASVGLFQKGGDVELIEFFLQRCQGRLDAIAEERADELGVLLLRDRLKALVQSRLEMLAPVLTQWPQALAIMGKPALLTSALQHLAVLIDRLWLLAGDESHGAQYHARRAALATIYTSAEMYMMSDFSPGFGDTWQFLDRRIAGMMECDKRMSEMLQLASAMGFGGTSRGGSRS
eukprot:jgi/Mesvir1/8846/Mv02742-RA.1